MVYVIWSAEHRAWWGPNFGGYRAKIADAGRYTRDEAIKVCTGARGGREHNHNPTEVPLLLDDAAAFWPDDRQEWENERLRRDRQQEASRMRDLGIDVDDEI